MLDVIDITIECRFFCARAHQHSVYSNHPAPFADHFDLLVADVALDVVITPRIRVRNDGGSSRELQNFFEARRVDVGQIDNQTKRFAFPHDFAPKRSQAVARRTAGRKDSPVAGGIAPCVGKSDSADAELVKNPEQIQISTEGLDSFHCQQQRDFAGLTRPANLLIVFANSEAAGRIRLSVDSRYLIERHAQSHFRQITVLDVNRDTEHTGIARFELRQIVGVEHIGATAFFVQIHWHVEVEIDNARRVKPVDPFFNRSLQRSHSVPPV